MSVDWMAAAPCPSWLSVWAAGLSISRSLQAQHAVRREQAGRNAHVTPHSPAECELHSAPRRKTARRAGGVGGYADGNEPHAGIVWKRLVGDRAVKLTMDAFSPRRSACRADR